MADATTLIGKPSANDCVITLNQIRGVYASCVVLDKNEAIGEIHIVASVARKPKQIVRDVETMLLVKHGVKVDYRKISLVQISDEQMLRIPIARPEIRQVTENVTGNRKNIRVEIRGASRTATGEAQESIENPTPFKTAARATIDAIEKLLGHSIDARLEQAETFRIGHREVLLVVTNCVIEDREETFVGASFVSGRPIESAARATLDALNRRIHNYTIQADRQIEPEI